MKNKSWKSVAGRAKERSATGSLMMRCLALGLLAMAFIVLCWGSPGKALAKDGAILDQLKTIVTVTSTVPANGDVNPYGVAQVKFTTGSLKAGHVLVSNFNNYKNQQGTGTTIVDVASDGTLGLFSQLTPSTLPGSCPGGSGLTTALVVLDSGWVIVGSLPTTDGTAATAQAGCLIVIDNRGNPVETIFGTLINGPWDMTAAEDGNGARLFVTNVLNGTVAANGTVVNGEAVVRINLLLPEGGMPWVESMTVIGSGFAERTDPAALVIGPTGVGLGTSGKGNNGNDNAQGNENGSGNQADSSVLYVADSLNNRIQVIDDALTRTSSAGTGRTLSDNGSLNDPLGLIVAPNGHILTVNGNDGFITEITPRGDQIASKLLDNTGSPPGSGALFGLGFDPKAGVYFVDNATNTLNLLGK